MDPQKKDTSESKQLLIKNSTVFYLVLAAIGLMIGYFSHNNLLSVTTVQESLYPHSSLAIIALLLTGVLWIQSQLFRDLFPTYRVIEQALTSTLRGLSPAALIYLSIISAIGEEVLFRVAIQPSIGMLPTALCFALLHSGPLGRLNAWVLSAFIRGLLMAWVFDRTGVLWPSLLGHMMINLIATMTARSTPSTTEPKSSSLSKKGID